MYRPFDDSRASHLKQSWRGSILPGVACYYVTTIVVVLAVSFGAHHVERTWMARDEADRPLISAFAVWDGEWYARIVERGYYYDSDFASNVAFFPAFPLAASAVIWLTGVSTNIGLAIVSNVFLCAAFILLIAYSRDRSEAPRESSAPNPVTTGTYAALALGLYPTSFYFRMAYTESMFIMLVILALYGMNRRWPLGVIALIIGLATATRSVGVALVLPFALHLWKASDRRVLTFMVRTTVLFPIACWGLLAYMTYQYVRFDEPLAFAKTQVNWMVRPIPDNKWLYLWDLLRLEPLMAVYDATSPCYWGKSLPHGIPESSMMFANPLYFVAAIAFTAIGTWKRWLTVEECLLAAALLAIPYFTQAYRFGFASHARFAAVAFPIYLVMAQLIARAPQPVVICVTAISAVLMAQYASLFVSWYSFY